MSGGFKFELVFLVPVLLRTEPLSAVPFRFPIGPAIGQPRRPFLYLKSCISALIGTLPI